MAETPCMPPPRRRRGRRARAVSWHGDYMCHCGRLPRAKTGLTHYFQDRSVKMAADFFLGESLVGDGNEVAHIDLVIGSKTGPAGAAFCTALTNNKDGFTTLLAVVAPNLPAK